MNNDSEELQQFLTTWKQELTVSKNSNHDGETSRENSQINYEHTLTQDPCNYDRFSEENTSNIKEFSSLETYSIDNKNENKCKPDHDSQSSDQSKDIILLNLPNPDKKQHINSNKTWKRQKLGGENEHENLLELLISDIDEITVVPFFDLQLPKEIGLKIFQFLSIIDLCHCAVVSKSWKHLADDDMLWYSFGVRLGFVGRDLLVSEKTNWKDFIYKCITEQRQMQSRWKERICKVDSMEYERGGILTLNA